MAIVLLEPQAPDSLLCQGYLDATFQTANRRVLEQRARDMLAKNPALKVEFDRKLHDDPTS